MGMFDSIKCLYKLPLTEELKTLPINWQEVSWQTKDLVNAMSEYTISKRGKLYLIVIEGDWIPLGANERKDFFWLDQKFVEKKRFKRLVKHHGVVNFYTTETIGEFYYWIEFKAYFTYGSLDSIELTRVEKYENTKQKILDNIEKEQNKPWNRFKNTIGPYGWNWFWKFVVRYLYKLQDTIGNIRTFIFKTFL